LSKGNRLRWHANLCRVNVEKSLNLAICSPDQIVKRTHRVLLEGAWTCFLLRWPMAKIDRGETTIVSNIEPKRGASSGVRTNDILTPSPQGPATRLVRGLARGHRNFAIAIAVVSSFVTMGLILVALGLLLTHVLEHGSVGVWDHHVIQWFDRHRSGHWNRITGDLTDVADTFEVAGVAAVVTIALLVRRWGRQAFLLVAGLAVELSVFLAANKIVARPRPAVSHLGGTPSTYSFPSGHTAATVVLWGGIAVIVMVATNRRWPGIVMWILAAVLTIAIGLSRVYRGEHYPTDVMAGLVLGIGSLGAGVYIIRVANVDRSAKSHSAQEQITARDVDKLDRAPE
jgi:membrane-associated phospholipid phosphatase